MWSGSDIEYPDEDEEYLNPSTVTMNGDKTVTGTFIERHTVTTASYTRGIITPNGGTWDHGQTVSFRWEKEQTFCFCQFTHWEGLPDSFSTASSDGGNSPTRAQ